MKKVEKNIEPLTFEEMAVQYSKRPRPTFLWSGIKEKSFGLVFGPSKSGKTIFCENLAMKISTGATNFLNERLDGIPKRVLFIGLEEFWENRAERNLKQFEALSNSEKTLLNKNYIYQPIEFRTTITTSEHWKELEKLISDSLAKVVIVDSITRMNHNKLEDSATAEKIMQRLRLICYNLKVTLICIHHTPKLLGQPITMDSIKGSSVFAQEADFAIGINRTPNKIRYVKNVFFRYAADDFDLVKEIELDPDIWLQFIGDVEEEQILRQIDRRRVNDSRQAIIDYFNKNTCTLFETKELIDYFESHLTIKERQIKSYLKELVEAEKVASPAKGKYISAKCTGSDEEE